MYALALNVLYVALAYTVFVACLALLLVFVVYGRKLIDSEVEPPRRRLSAGEMDALLRALGNVRPPSKGARVTVASSDEEAFLKLADEGQALLRREAKDV